MISFSGTRMDYLFFFALGLAFFFVLADFGLALALGFALGLGFGIALGLHSRDRVVASLPQSSQKQDNSTRFGKQTCLGSEEVWPQNSQTANDASSILLGVQRCPFRVVVFPQVVHTCMRDPVALAMIPPPLD